MRELVRSGELGQLGMVHSWYFNDWLYRPRLPEELDTRLGGGVVFRQSADQFDIIRLVGKGLLRSVRAMTGRWDPERPTEGSYVAYLEFGDGAAATAGYGGYDHFHTTELTGVDESGIAGERPASGRARHVLREAGGPGSTGELALKQTRGYGGKLCEPRPGERRQSHYRLVSRADLMVREF